MLPSCARTVLGSARGIPNAGPYHLARAMSTQSSNAPLVMQLLVDPRLIKVRRHGPSHTDTEGAGMDDGADDGAGSACHVCCTFAK